MPEPWLGENYEQRHGRYHSAAYARKTDADPSGRAPACTTARSHSSKQAAHRSLARAMESVRSLHRRVA
eukprot:14438145-Alexandrium_andersonii.AAC.1